MRWSILFVLCWCAACATLARPTQDSLAQCAQQLMTARASGDWGIVYDLTSQTFQTTTSREAFMAIPRTVGIQNPEVLDVTAGEDGRGATLVRYDIAVMGFVFRGKEERIDWLWEKGQWRYTYDVGLPFGQPLSGSGQ